MKNEMMKFAREMDDQTLWETKEKTAASLASLEAEIKQARNRFHRASDENPMAAAGFDVQVMDLGDWANDEWDWHEVLNRELERRLS